MNEYIDAYSDEMEKISNSLCLRVWYEKRNNFNRQLQVHKATIFRYNLQLTQHSYQNYKIILKVIRIFSLKYIATANHCGQEGCYRPSSLTICRSFIYRIPRLAEYSNHIINTKVFYWNKFWKFELLLFPFFFRIHFLER